MSEINYQALREAAEAIKVVATPQKLLAFRMKVTPQVVLALLDEIKRLEDTNIDAMCRIGEFETNLAALATENAGLKAICDDRRRLIMNGVQKGYIKVPTAETDPDLETIRIAISPQKPIPATDAFLAEVRAGAFNDLCAAFVMDARGVGLDDDELVTLKDATGALLHCAEQLREGGSQ
ncbi:ead/Ea22-like family protein [Escherichia coli]|uniref:ead/Ea22-like family protein n=1 Tax=Escherichia coli TaxID=562 RepID=UPI001C403402|nr:ead/Ea22-like family protein [Escherichia coli]